MAKLECGKYVEFDLDHGVFNLSVEAGEIIYREKNCICSYSGANEWCNHIFCQLIDLYSGSSPFNMALGTCEHEKQIPYFWRENRDGVINWINKHTESEWFKIACKTFETIFDNIPVM